MFCVLSIHQTLEMFSALVRELHDVRDHPACESSNSLDF